MQGLPRQKEWFIIKQTVGMCGVGKWMKRWKKWQDGHCPRCGQTGDASHIVICKGENSQQIWVTSLKLLSKWMTSVQTDPNIIDTIIDHLRLWHQGYTTTPEGQESIQHALDIQNDLGWHSLLEGWLWSGK
jgi:hypothetical protein